jgi:hypothetical protein
MLRCADTVVGNPDCEAEKISCSGMPVTYSLSRKVLAIASLWRQTCDTVPEKRHRVVSYYAPLKGRCDMALNHIPREWQPLELETDKIVLRVGDGAVNCDFRDGSRRSPVAYSAVFVTVRQCPSQSIKKQKKN